MNKTATAIAFTLGLAGGAAGVATIGAPRAAAPVSSHLALSATSGDVSFGIKIGGKRVDYFYQPADDRVLHGETGETMPKEVVEQARTSAKMAREALDAFAKVVQ